MSDSLLSGVEAALQACRRRLIAVAATTTLLTATAVIGTATPANATTPPSCTTTAAASCSSTGTATLTGGNLDLVAPTALDWGNKSITGATINAVDTSHTTYTVDDLTGTGAGWHVAVAATTFTSSSTPAHTLPDSGTLSTNGDTSSIAGTTAPSPACVTGTLCTAPTNSITYPLAITTAATPTPSTIYSAGAGTGLGDVQISSVGWWLHIPGNAYAGTYTSTITFSVVSAP